MCVVVVVGGYVNAGNCSSQKRVSDPLGWKLQLVVSHLIWVLETKLRSSPRAVCTLNSCPPIKFLQPSWEEDAVVPAYT